MLDHPGLLVILAPKVHQDLKVKPEPPVKMVKMEQTDPMDNPVKLVNLVHKVLVDSREIQEFPAQRDIEDYLAKLEKMARTDAMVNLVHKELKEMLVQLVFLDLLDNKVPVDILVNLEMPDHEEQMVCLVNLVHPVQWEQLAPLDSLVALDQRENLEFLAIKVLKVPKVHVVKMVAQDHQALLVFLEPQVWTEQMELRAQQVMLVHLDHPAFQVLEDHQAHKEIWVPLVSKVTKVFLVLLVLREMKDQRENKEKWV